MFSVIDMQCCDNLKGLNTVVSNGVNFNYDVAKLAPFVQSYNGSTPTIVKSVDIDGDVYYQIVGDYVLDGFADTEHIGFADLSTTGLCKGVLNSFNNTQGNSTTRKAAFRDLPMGIQDSFNLNDAVINEVSTNDIFKNPTSGWGITDSFNDVLNFADFIVEFDKVEGINKSFGFINNPGVTARYSLSINEIVEGTGFAIQGMFDHINCDNLQVQMVVDNIVGIVTHFVNNIVAPIGNTRVEFIDSEIPQFAISYNNIDLVDFEHKFGIIRNTFFTHSYKDITVGSPSFSEIVNSIGIYGIDDSYTNMNGDVDYVFRVMTSATTPNISGFGLSTFGTTTMHVTSAFSGQTWYQTAKTTHGFTEVIL